MIVLDTNVLSAVMLNVPDQQVADWLDRQAPESIWTTAITVFEIRVGIESSPRGKRRSHLEQAFSDMLAEDLESRVLPFDEAAAEAAAAIASRRRRTGVTIDLRDTQIAGIATTRKASLATRNTRDFSELEVTVVNPWRT